MPDTVIFPLRQDLHPRPAGWAGEKPVGRYEQVLCRAGSRGFPWSASTASKRWRLFRFLFGRSKRNIDNGWMPFILLPVAPFLLTSFSDERSKALRQDAVKSPPQRWRLFRFLFGRSKRNIHPRRPPLKIQQETSKKFLLPFCFPKRKQGSGGTAFRLTDSKPVCRRGRHPG